jgi:hypothetical protein
MVISTRKLLTVEEAERIIEEGKNKADMVNKLRSLKRREKAPPPPEGGIGIREAGRKYGLSRQTISRWAKDGKIKILERTSNWLYIDEKSLKVFLGRSKN